MKQIIVFDEELGKKLKDHIYSRKATGDAVSISSFVRDCVRKELCDEK